MANPWSFNHRQVFWSLENYITLHRGIWPDVDRAECYSHGALMSARAKFESASMLAAEISARVRRCDKDGYVVEERYGMATGVIKPEDEIASGRHMRIEEVYSTISKVAWYCTSERDTNGARRLEAYEIWRTRTRSYHHYRQAVIVTSSAP